MKQHKLTVSLFVIFFLQFFLSSGEDVSWMGIIVTSVLYSSMMTLMSLIVIALLRAHNFFEESNSINNLTVRPLVPDIF